MAETPSTSTVERPADGAGEAADAQTPRRPALSPSRAADFKQCPLLYRFRAIDRLPEVPSRAQVRGTLVHAVLERLFTLPAAQRVPAVARALVGPAWAQLCEADPRLPAAVFGGTSADPEATPAEPPAPPRPAATGPSAGTLEVPELSAWLDGVGPLLDAYFTLEDPRLFEPEARELLVEAELESGLLLRGYVDRIDPVGPDEAATGEIRVVDYKTGTAPRPAAEARALFQMKFYALVLLRLRGRAPSELRLMYLTGPEALSYTPDEVQLHRFGRMLDALWVAIRAAGTTGDFRPNPGPGCSWCCHRTLCPAWGGVSPPYPGWPSDPDPPNAGA